MKRIEELGNCKLTPERQLASLKAKDKSQKKEIQELLRVLALLVAAGVTTEDKIEQARSIARWD